MARMINSLDSPEMQVNCVGVSPSDWVARSLYVTTCRATFCNFGLVGLTCMAAMLPSPSVEIHVFPIYSALVTTSNPMHCKFFNRQHSHSHVTIYDGHLFAVLGAEERSVSQGRQMEM